MTISKFLSMDKSGVRQSRIQTLVRMAEKGASRAEIINYALSWGISQKTARDYHSNVVAIVKKAMKQKEVINQLKTKPNEYDNSEQVVGSGSDIIKPTGKSEGSRSWFNL